MFSPFGTFIVPPGFVWHTQLLLKARDGGGRCNPPDAYSCPAGRSTQVFRPTEIRVFPLLRCLLHYGRWRTKWASDTSGSERRDTIEYRSWAIGKYSNESHFHQKCQSFRTLNSGMHSDNNVGRVLIQAFARNRSSMRSMFSVVPCDIVKHG